LTEVLENLKIEMRRGTMTLIILHLLKEKTYGYLLLQELSSIDVNIEAGTLYPLLRRLEKQELLDSDWDTSEARPRKYYYLSKTGYIVYEQLKEEWHKLSQKTNQLL